MMNIRTPAVAPGLADELLTWSYAKKRQTPIRTVEIDVITAHCHTGSMGVFVARWSGITVRLPRSRTIARIPTALQLKGRLIGRETEYER
ncbi:MAG: hypothetical protein P8170_20225 [Gemmatimonadota bacterium]|jgi:hypothetical protein